MMHQVDSPFIFKLFQPKGRLSAYVQGVWTASVSSEGLGSIKRWLQGDACSGILFNLGEAIYLDETQYSDRVILLPISKHAHSVTLPPGTQLAGIRFHPGINFGLFGKLNDKPVTVEDCALLSEVQAIAIHLMKTPGHYARIVALYKWLNKVIDFSDVVPVSFLQALNTMQKTQTLGLLCGDIPLSQRQLERQFQKRMGMTLKQCQRILRVKKTLNYLKINPNSDLVALALDEGFSDQSHMTREFKQIAKITPWQYNKLVARRQAELLPGKPSTHLKRRKEKINSVMYEK